MGRGHSVAAMTAHEDSGQSARAFHRSSLLAGTFGQHSLRRFPRRSVHDDRTHSSLANVVGPAERPSLRCTPRSDVTRAHVSGVRQNALDGGFRPAGARPCRVRGRWGRNAAPIQLLSDLTAAAIALNDLAEDPANDRSFLFAENEMQKPSPLLAERLGAIEDPFATVRSDVAAMVGVGNGPVGPVAIFQSLDLSSQTIARQGA